MNIKKTLKILGPGLLWAGAAIGVSHLVQSTRAGAYYGFYFVGILLLANVLKYPSFEFAPRYASATGNNLIYGYKKIGKWAILLFALLTFFTMFTIQAAVTIVTAGLVGNIFGVEMNAAYISIIILVVTMLLLLIGKFKLLDQLMKFIIIILAITTLWAVINGFINGFHPNSAFIQTFDWHSAVDLAFLIAFIGWMPAPIDVAVWHSFWSVEKKKQTGSIPLKEALLDFKIGYIGTVILALAFLSLGALFMYANGTTFSGSAIQFSGQLINMFTKSIGNWAYFIIAIAALTTMFSTTLTCMDAYSRVLPYTTHLLVKDDEKEPEKRSIIFWMTLLITGTSIILLFFIKNMKTMVDLATTISFVTAPVLAILNYMVVTGKEMPESSKPNKFMRMYAWLSIVFLSLFSLFYLYWRFFS